MRLSMVSGRDTALTTKSKFSNFKPLLKYRGHGYRHCNPLLMTVVPCSLSRMDVIAPRTVTVDQWKAYWGLNKKERLGLLLY